MSVPPLTGLEVFVSQWMGLSRGEGPNTSKPRSKPKTTSTNSSPRYGIHVDMKKENQINKSRPNTAKSTIVRNPSAYSSEVGQADNEAAVLPWQQPINPELRKYITGEEKRQRSFTYYKFVKMSGNRLPSPGKSKNIKCKTEHINKPRLTPLDFSFSNIRDLQSLFQSVPRCGKAKIESPTANITLNKPTENTWQKHEDDPTELLNQSSSLKRILLGDDGDGTPRAKQQYVTNCLKLSNNMITNIDQIGHIVKGLVHNATSMLTILDLSFNAIVQLPSNWGGLPIVTLYLHSNSISDMEQVMKLAVISSTLMNLTLHGNQVITKHDYKIRVLNLLPNLRSLDFSALTTTDKEEAVYLTHSITKDKRRRPKSPESPH